MMNNQKFTILTLVLIASVIASPFVYAVVEPHIKITMDASQTTKPLQIVNNLDQEVFSVDVDGTIFPEPVFIETDPTSSNVELRFEKETATACPIGATWDFGGTNVLTNPVILKEWQLNNPDNTDSVVQYHYITGQFNDSDGLHTVSNFHHHITAWVFSDDGGATYYWNYGIRATGQSVSQSTNPINSGGNSDDRFLPKEDNWRIAIVCINANENVDFSELENVSAYMQVILGEGSTITEVP